MILAQSRAVVRERTNVVWLGLVFVLVILPYVALASFVHPIGDDFTYAFDTRRDGYWAAYRGQYHLWNGRYTSNLFVLGGPMVRGSIVGYRLIAVGMIVATVLAAYVFIRAVARDAWTRGEAVVAALGLTALYLAAVPALGESIYWYTSAVTYQLSAILATIQAALVIHALADRSPSAAWRLTAAVLLLAAVVGMNEVTMVILTAFYGALLVVGALEGRRRVARVAGFMLAVATVCGLVVWLAPGNDVRGGMYPARHDVVRSVTLTALQTIRFAAEWATLGPLLLASLLYLPLGTEIARRAPAFGSMTRRGWMALPACALLTIAIAAFAPYWATGILGQHRTMGVAYFFFLLLWFATLTALLATGWLPAPHGWLADGHTRVATAVLLLAALAFTHNGYRVAIDFAQGRPLAFDREMSARYAALRACTTAPQSRCVIRPIVTKPESFYILDVSTDPGDWVNNGYAYYFGVGRVMAKTVP